MEKVANDLDNRGLSQHASIVDKAMKRLANGGHTAYERQLYQQQLQQNQQADLAQESATFQYSPNGRNNPAIMKRVEQYRAQHPTTPATPAAVRPTTPATPAAVRPTTPTTPAPRALSNPSITPGANENSTINNILNSAVSAHKVSGGGWHVINQALAQHPELSQQGRQQLWNEFAQKAQQMGG